jgi:serine/threonine-protein phosphatase 2A regulatory subunit B
MADLRLSAQSDNSALNFKYEPTVGGQKNFFTEMISSYSSAQFLKNGKFIVSRDFLTVKVWDICNTKKPVTTVTIQ